MQNKSEHADKRTGEQDNKRTRGQAYEAVVVAWEKLGVASRLLEATQLVEFTLPTPMITAQMC